MAIIESVTECWQRNHMICSARRKALPIADARTQLLCKRGSTRRLRAEAQALADARLPASPSAPDPATPTSSSLSGNSYSLCTAASQARYILDLLARCGFSDALTAKQTHSLHIPRIAPGTLPERLPRLLSSAHMPRPTEHLSTTPAQASPHSRIT